MRSSCRGRCTLNDKCVSYNVGPPIKDQVLCQLSDSDHIQHPEDLVTREGFVYQNSEVRYFDCIRFYVNLWLSLCYFLFIYPFMKICNLFVCFRLTPLNFKLKLNFTIPSVLLRVVSVIYRQNSCLSNPCPQNTTCLNGFTEKGYLCTRVCQFGYTGKKCKIGKYTYKNKDEY